MKNRKMLWSLLILGALLYSPLQQLLLSDAAAQSTQSGLVINEIYAGSGGLLTTDQFIELYNNGNKTEYLDGMLLVRFGSGGKLSSGALTGIGEAWKFPGKPGGTTLRVLPGEFIVVAQTAWKGLTGLDLSTANFETYSGLDVDNSAPNLTRIDGGSGDLNLSSSTDAVALASGIDSVTKDGIAVQTIVDAVQYSTASQTGNLPQILDAGVAGGSTLKLGMAIERKQKGLTTHNSSVDFEVVKPTPGYQHGGSAAAGIRVTDLFPLELGRYVEYDSYITDTTGAPDKTTRTDASTTVIAVGQSFEGMSGVATVRDSSEALGTQVTDVRYAATAQGDVHAYADANFLSLFFPSALSQTITPPNTFVDYLKMSDGIGKSYSVATINQTITMQGQDVSLNVVTNGVFRGVEAITVNGRSFDSAYKFVLTSNADVSISIVPLFNITVEESIWLVKGIGIVKTNSATPGGSTPVPITGSERDMKGYGVRAVDLVAAKPNEKKDLLISYNLQHATIVFHASEPLGNLIIYNSNGECAMSIREEKSNSYPLNFSTLPAGAYYVRRTVREQNVIENGSFLILR